MPGVTFHSTPTSPVCTIMPLTLHRTVRSSSLTTPTTLSHALMHSLCFLVSTLKLLISVLNQAYVRAL